MAAKTVKLHNPHLLAVNPFTPAKPARRAKANGRKAKTTTKRGKKNPSTVRAQRNPDVSGILLRGTAAGVGALVTTFVANLLPLPVNPLLNAGAKALVATGIGYGAKMIRFTAPYADFVTAGGVGVAAADGLRFLVPKLRTVIVADAPQADAVKALAPAGELNDLVIAPGNELMGDVVDSMPYNSEWAA